MSTSQGGSPAANTTSATPVPSRSADTSYGELMSACLDVSLAAVALTSAGAALKGMHTSDWFCLWHISQASGTEPVSSGQLAELTGLTSGAITGVIDRLEGAGYVRRERDIKDRRKWHVRLVAEREAEIYALYAPLDSAFQEIDGRYDAESRAIILDYLKHVADGMRGQVVALRAAKKRQ